MAPEENYPSVRVRVWVNVRVSVGDQFSPGAIVLEPRKWVSSLNIYIVAFLLQLAPKLAGRT